jgi:hypothetical protein
VSSWMIHQLKAIVPILGFPGSCATYGRCSYATAHNNTANDSPHRAGVSREFLRPPKLPPNASAAVAVVVAIWCNRPNDVLRGSSSRSGTAGLRISVWRISDLLLLQIAASLLALSIEGNTLTEYGVDVL